MRAPGELLHGWLERRIPAEGVFWLDGQLGKLQSGIERDLVITLGLIPRRLGKADLDLSAAELAEAETAVNGWDPRGWTVDSSARVLAMLSFKADSDTFARVFADICRSADAAEAIALFSGLPLYPAGPGLLAAAAEGVRGNIRAVFEAVAHRSPYPRRHFDQDRWNQMVLKALFIGSTLHPIQGLDERANPVLARILCDYAHERWAAGRPVTPELWRCVGPFAQSDMLDDLGRVAASADPRERSAAALALSASPSPEARALLASLAAEVRRIETEDLTWDTVVAQPKAEELQP
jgi:hypothetical protein